MMVVNYYNFVVLFVILIKILNFSIFFGYFLVCSYVMVYIYVMFGGRWYVLDMRIFI